MRHYYNDRDGQVAQAKRFQDSGVSGTVVFSSPYTVKVRKEVESQRMEEVDLDTGRRRSWVETKEFEVFDLTGETPAKRRRSPLADLSIPGIKPNVVTSLAWEQQKRLASTKLSRHMKMVVERKRFVKMKKSAVVIQKFWRGYWHRKVVMERISEMAETYRAVKEVRQRLEEATAVAKPEDCLAARTSSAIDCIFSIRNVIRAVKTLDLSTRLSLECCVKMTEAFSSGSPVTQLVSLIALCNRSETLKEVIIVSVDY